MSASRVPSSPARKRLLIISPDFPPTHGGIQLIVHRLTTMIRTFDVTVVTRGARDHLQFDASLKADIWRSPRASSRFVDLALLDATALTAAFLTRPDVVLNAHIITGTSTRLISRLGGVPACVYLHADELVRHPRLAALAIGASEVAVAVSEHTRRLALACGADAGKVQVIPPGVDVPGASSAKPRRRPTILTIARLEDRFKGHDTIVRALPHVLERVPDVEWVVVGDGSLRAELERSVASGQLEAHVRFLGAVEDEVRDMWLDQAHVFVMPSRLPPGSGG